LGPTISVCKADDLKIIYTNLMAENVSMTVAGLQLHGPLIRVTERMMSPNADVSQGLTIRQIAATLRCQSKTRYRTTQQVYYGHPG
ncbi:multicopper oxidase domain-containing protein, partial [Salmonella enterica subsp. enterica serovar Infantis]